MLYVGSLNEFKSKPFIESCKDKAPTLCVVRTKKGKIFGMYTEIAWSNDGYMHRLNNNSSVFKIHKDNSFTLYEHKKGHDEVMHSNFGVFCMCDGPYAI